MKNPPTFSEINSLFTNNDPEEVWFKVSEIVIRINPAYDFHIVRTAYNDIVRLFRGEYPGYSPVQTLYHDLRHMLDVLICATRLMHGVQLSGYPLNDDEITIILLAAMMHDIGYAQQLEEQWGTGAQHTRSRVARSSKFAQEYIASKGFPDRLAIPMDCILRCTDPAVDISEIDFPDPRARLLGQIVGSADLTGQMADRTYLEKLLFLYLEFKEAHFGGYQNVHDLLNKTRYFYVATRRKLEENFAGLHNRLSAYFQEWFGTANNYYLESIEKNMAYLTTITALDKAEHRSKLRRGGIVQRVETLLPAMDFL